MIHQVVEYGSAKQDADLDARLEVASDPVFYFDLLHDRPEMGGVVQFSTALLRSLKKQLGQRVVAVSTLRRRAIAGTSMEAFTQEADLARALAERHPEATFLFPHFLSPLTERGPRQRVVNVVHDVQFKACPEYYSQADAALLATVFRQLRDRADDVLFISEASRTDFFRHFGAPRRHAVIGAPVETRAAAPFVGDAPYLLATSHNSNHPHKNLPGLLDLFARLAARVPDLQLRMTGFGREVVAAQLARLPAGLVGRVHHHGVVARHELDALYDGAYAFASLSRFEGFNLSAAEAAVHGTPLLLSDLPAHRELFGDLALFTAAETPVETILAHVEQRRANPRDWAHRHRCTPDAVASAVAARIAALQDDRCRIAARSPAARGGARRRSSFGSPRASAGLKAALMSSAVALFVVDCPSGHAQTVLTHGGNSAGGAAGGNYNQNGGNAPFNNGGGGGGGPSPTGTTGGTDAGNGGTGGNGGANGVTDGPAVTIMSATGVTGQPGAQGVLFGGGGGAGGYGQVFSTTSTVTNGLTQTGGNGGNGGGATNTTLVGGGGGGGGGLLLIQGGTITNTALGSLIGGNGGLGGAFVGATGGAGLETSASSTTFTATVNNSHIITGGLGGLAANGNSSGGPTTPGVGGAGVALVGGGAVNNFAGGAITGGAGGASGTIPSPNGPNYTGFGGAGGNGIDLYIGGTLSNAANGTITGGAGAVGIPGQIPNGGGTPARATNGGAGGVGVNLIGGALTFSAPNLGTIAGGAGGTGGGNSTRNGAGGKGGDAVFILGGSDATAVANGGTGVLQGGAGGNAGTFVNGTGFTGANGGAGGLGVNAGTTQNLLSFSNAAGGQVSGGNGGTGGTTSNANAIAATGGAGGAGGAGVLFATVPTFTNAGTITAGSGGAGGNGVAGAGPVIGGTGGAGGVGAQFNATGVSVVNTNGTINGGNGGAGGTGANGGAAGTLGSGGMGVVGSGLTIENTNGTISGGTGLANASGNTRNYAVQLNGDTNSISYGGTINGGINVAGTSTFQPALNGSAVGTTLTVNGPIAFASGTTFNVRLTPTAFDSVTLTGANGVATLGGAAVFVTATAGTYTAGQRTILHSSVAGIGPANGNTFGVVTTNLAFLTPMLNYDANDVFLNIVGNAVATQPGGVDYTTVAVTQNQRAVATGLTNASNLNGNTGPVLNALNQLTAPQARAAFDSLSGEGITATQNLAHRSSELFDSAIFDQTTFYGSSNGNSITLTTPPSGNAFCAVVPSDRLKVQPIRELGDLPSSRQSIAPSSAPAQRTWRVWGSGFGGADDYHGSGAIGSATQSNTIYGGVVGVDYQLTPNHLLGVAVGGSDGEFSVPNRASFGSTTGGHIAIYDIARFGTFYGASSVSGSFYQNRTTRTVAGFGGLASETERGNFFSDEFRTRLEFGRKVTNPFGIGGVVTPFVALELAQLRSNGFGEQTIGGPGGQGLFALNVSGQSTASVPSFVGVRYQTIVPLGNGMTLVPSLQAAFVHEFAPERTQFAGLASLPGATFLVDGARPARNAAQVKAGGELALGPHTAIFADFDGEVSNVNQLYAGKGGLKYRF